MTSRDFCYWLQGLFELNGPKSLDERQTELVRRHLAMVFRHEIDPSVGSVEHQEELGAIHEGKEDPPVKKSELDSAIKKLAASVPPRDLILRC